MQQVRAEGPEITVDTSNEAQQYNTTTALKGGGYVVAWTSFDYAQNDDAGSIRLQVYGADGAPVGGERQANTRDVGLQEFPSIAALDDGGFVVAWQSYTTVNHSSTTQPFGAQRFDAAGVPQGGEFTINDANADGSFPGTDVQLVGVTGGFVATWSRPGDTASGHSQIELAGQRFTDGGARDGGIFLLNSLGAPYRYADARLSATSDGGFVAAWQRFDTRASGDSTIIAQRFDAAVAKVGAEQVVDQASKGYNVDVAALSDGGYAVVWQTGDASYDGSAGAILSRRFDTAGQGAATMLVNTTTTGEQVDATVTAIGDGGFAVGWRSYVQSGRAQIDTQHGQLFDRGGHKQGAEFTVESSSDGGESHTDSTTLVDGSLVYTWTSTQSAGGTASIHSRQFAVDTGFDGGNGDETRSAPDDQDWTALGHGGKDQLTGKGGNDHIGGGTGDDRLDGGDGADVLIGQVGDDVLIGGDGDDKLYGSAGRDILVGGAGHDLLTGGADADTFRFDALTDTGATLKSSDRILDFSQAEGDRIDLRGIDAIGGGGDDAFTWIGTAGFSGHAGELHIRTMQGLTVVEGDVTGDGRADFMIRLDGHVALTAGDVYL